MSDTTQLFNMQRPAKPAKLRFVRPDDALNRPHDMPGVTPSPASPWLTGDRASFSDGRWHWDGTQWQRGAKP